MNNFHRIWFQNFRQISNLFSQIWLKKRHTSLFSGICREIRTKIHQKFAEKMENSSFSRFPTSLKHRRENNSTKKMKKSEIQLFNREKMLTIFGWNFEIWAVQKYVNLVDFVKSFPTSIHLKKSASRLLKTCLLACVETAENEPLKVWMKIQFNIHSPP